MQRIGKVAALITGKVMNIDHHVSNGHFADWEYVRTDCAATGEILTELFRIWEAAITPAMANALYMAIATDCGFFCFANTTGHTLQMASYLVDAGAEPNRISEGLEETTMNKLKALAQVLQEIELFAGGRVAGISFTQEVQQYTGEHTGGYIDYARRLKGVDVAFTVKWQGPETTRVSLRSKEVDVNVIAGAFGGGGHVRAAGCTLALPLEEAKQVRKGNRKEPMIQGIINVLKPSGMSSHDIIGQVRRIYGMKKVGHSGTLDPLAAGVLPVFWGRPRGSSNTAAMKIRHIAPNLFPVLRRIRKTARER